MLLYLLIFSLVFINTAWLGDDIFITFRAVDNFLKGYGPVWNVGERVQVYTHPLWYALLVIGIGIFKHHYWFTLALSYACLLGTLYLFLKIARHGNLVLAMLASVALLLSRAFADYSSSGLENPLLHLLLCAYVLVSITQQDAAKRFLHTSLLYSLLFLTRPDAVVLVTPASLWMLWQASKACGWRRTLKLAAIAAAPALAWEVFSLIYYGSLVPNTAIAKTNLGYPRSEMLARGWEYMKVCFHADPITLGTILLAFPLAAVLGKGNLPKLLMGGVALQLVYICWVGGDYMAGRFLTTSLLASAISITLSRTWAINFNIKKEIPLILGGTSITFAALYNAPPTIKANIKQIPNYSPASIYSPQNISNYKNNRYGIMDERAYYYARRRALGLMHVIKNKKLNPYTSEWIQFGKRIENATRSEAGAVYVAGMPAWRAGSKPYFLDVLALGDPYLSRLPAQPNQRTGHYMRSIPKGYAVSVMTGKNAISNNILASLYNDVTLVTRAPIFSKKRWQSIWRLHSKSYNTGLKDIEPHSDSFLNSINPCSVCTPFLFGSPAAFSQFIKAASDDIEVLKTVIVNEDVEKLASLAAQISDDTKSQENLASAVKNLWYFLISEADLGRTSKLKFLLDAGLDPNTSDTNGYFPLDIAARLGNVSIMQMLLEHGASIDASSESGETALMMAARNGYANAVEFLLDSGANINTATQNGKTALSFALEENHTPIAEMLLKKGARLSAALASSSWQGHLEAVQFLLAHGAKINRPAGGKHKMTPLMHAAYHGHKDLVIFFLDNGANANALTAREDTALSLALSKNHYDIAKILLDKGANPSDALLPASWSGNRKAVRYLLAHNADINHKGGIGVKWTPLMHAAYHGHLGVLSILLLNGADQNIRGNAGETALHLATIKERTRIVEILSGKRPSTVN